MNIDKLWICSVLLIWRGWRKIHKMNINNKQRERSLQWVIIIFYADFILLSLWFHPYRVCNNIMYININETIKRRYFLYIYKKKSLRVIAYNFYVANLVIILFFFTPVHIFTSLMWLGENNEIYVVFFD